MTSLPLVNEVARTVAKNTKIHEQPDRDKTKIQLAIFHRQLLMEAVHKKGFVSDRSAYDAIAYSTYYGINENIIEWMLEELRPPRYDLLIFCPIPEKFTIEDDGCRMTDKKSARTINQVLTCIVNMEKNVLWLPRKRELWIPTIQEVLPNVQCIHREG